MNDAAPDPGAGADEPGFERIPGDRGITSVNQVRSLQSRVTTWMAIVLMGALAVGFLTWYYRGVISRANAPQDSAVRTLGRRAQGEMILPPLGRTVIPVEAPSVTSTYASFTEPSPDLVTQHRPTNYANSSAPAVDAELARQLKGRVFVPLTESGSAGGVPNPSGDEFVQEGSPIAMGDQSDLTKLLTARTTPAVAARLLPTQRMLLPKGAFIDCTLETAIDSQLPGMTTCITATDTFGADGTVVLLERGSKLVGETRGQVRQGGNRLFVLWTEARTPTGVVIPLASPGTDELGRSGITGEVDRHFWARFGSALLITIIDGAVQAVTQELQSGTIVISPTATRDLGTEVLRETVLIPPTLRKNQGDRIQVLVARDLDFRGVYRLKYVE